LSHRQDPPHLFLRCILVSIAEIVCNSPGEQPGLLGNIGDPAPEFMLGNSTHIRTAYTDGAFRHIMETEKQLCNRGFSTSCSSDHCCCLTFPASKIQICQCILICIGKSEGDIAKAGGFQP